MDTGLPVSGPHRLLPAIQHLASQEQRVCKGPACLSPLEHKVPGDTGGLGPGSEAGVVEGKQLQRERMQSPQELWARKHHCRGRLQDPDNEGKACCLSLCPLSGVDPPGHSTTVEKALCWWERMKQRRLHPEDLLWLPHPDPVPPSKGLIPLGSSLGPGPGGTGPFSCSSSSPPL